MTPTDLRNWQRDLDDANKVLSKIEDEINKLPPELVEQAWEVEIEKGVKVAYPEKAQHLDNTRIMSMSRALAIMSKLEKDTLFARIGGPITTALNQATATASTVLDTARTVKATVPNLLRAFWADLKRRATESSAENPDPASYFNEAASLIIGNWILIWSVKDIIKESKETIGLMNAAVDSARKAAFPQKDSAQGGKRVRHWKRSRRN